MTWRNHPVGRKAHCTIAYKAWSVGGEESGILFIFVSFLFRPSFLWPLKVRPL